MPRKRKTQPNVQPTGLPYGQGKQIHDMQAAVPLPAAPAPGEVPAQLGGGQPAPQGGGLVPDAIAAAQGIDMGPGLLNEPPPGAEPLTAGLPIGPGAGPEVLQGVNRANLFSDLAVATGDSRFLRLAQQARMVR